MSADKSHIGSVLKTSRRVVTLLLDDDSCVDGHLRSNNLDVAVGDRCEFTHDRSEMTVTKRLDPENVLIRTYFKETRRIAANVDHLFLGAAVEPLFNTAFVDRLLTVAILEQIPATLLLNKVDLGVESTRALVDIYRSLNIDILHTSATRGDGMNELRSQLSDPKLRFVVFAGVSGVGKSTIINSLVPEANARVGTVSERTGQGKQTTTQPLGHLMPRSGVPAVVLVDLPGIQRFGTAHLDPTAIVYGFPEILEAAKQCPFGDCSHFREEDCAVKHAVEEGKIAISRYQSFVEMCAESEEARSYS